MVLNGKEVVLVEAVGLKPFNLPVRVRDIDVSGWRVNLEADKHHVGLLVDPCVYRLA